MPFYSKTGNTLSYYGVQRTSPKQHDVGAICVMADVAELFNYFEDLVGDTLWGEQIDLLKFKIYGGSIRYAGSYSDIVDTEITVTDNTTNYIYLDLSDLIIKNTTVEATAKANSPIYTVVASAGSITSFEPYNIREIASGKLNSFEVTVGGADSGADYQCDGVDDDVEISAALTYASSNNLGTVKILAGTYSLTSQVNAPSSVNLFGEGLNTILRDDRSIADKQTEAVIKWGGESDFIIKNIKIDGDTSAIGGYVEPFGVYACSNFHIENVSVVNSSNVAVGIVSCTNWFARFASIESYDHVQYADGIRVTDVSHASIYCDYISNGDDGIVVWSSNDLTIGLKRYGAVYGGAGKIGGTGGACNNIHFEYIHDTWNSDTTYSPGGVSFALVQETGVTETHKNISVGTIHSYRMDEVVSIGSTGAAGHSDYCFQNVQINEVLADNVDNFLLDISSTTKLLKNLQIGKMSQVGSGYDTTAGGGTLNIYGGEDVVIDSLYLKDLDGNGIWFGSFSVVDSVKNFKVNNFVIDNCVGRGV